MPDHDMPVARPDTTPPCPPGTFQLGLALAGAVSGGAYAAGVMDFLIEALGRWYRAKADGQAVPTHDVVLRVISGASAGSVNGMIAAAALPYAFPHVHASDLSDAAANPFYDTWVRQLDIGRLLRSDDLADPDAPLTSLLDSTCLDEIARGLADIGGEPATRPYISNPLKLIFTVTNLRGVPYAIPFGGGREASHSMVAHADFLRFALDTGQGAYATNWQYPDDLYVRHPRARPDGHWNTLIQAALASSAFPAGLRYREVHRRWSDYAQRAVVVPDETGMATAVPIVPNDASLPSQGPDYRFVAVDGGAMDNEPFELARTELAGILGHNPRSGDQVNRIVLMVDPFPEPDELGPDDAARINIVESLTGLFAAWKQQARFKPEEIALAMNDAVFSRFLIAPCRPGTDGTHLYGGRAIAAGALGGFSGFFSERYREHDFLLGRRNCQRFLAEHFLVPASNPIVADWAGRPELHCFLRKRDGVTYAPVIPLLEACDPSTREDDLPAWPKGAFDPASIMPSIRTRMDALYGSATNRWRDKLLTWIAWRFFARRKLLDIASRRIEKSLRDADLL